MFLVLYCDDVRLGVRVFFLFLDFVSDTVYVDLKYDDVFVLWLIVVCEWVGGDLFVMGCLLSVLGVVVSICVGVLMVHLQSCLYCRCFICVHFR